MKASNKRILIADDNLEFHNIMKTILNFGLLDELADSQIDALQRELFGEGTEGSAQSSNTQKYIVDCTLQGKEAYGMVLRAKEEGRPYWLAILDMRMPPGWDGLETARHILAKAPETEIIICTAYSDTSWKEIELELKKNVFLLKKPFSIEELEALLKKLNER
jgi:CheY-like chemotaxis protein